MTPEQHAQVRDIFLDVIAQPPEERASLVEQRCGGSAELQREVERLLEHHREGTLQIGPIESHADDEGWSLTTVREGEQASGGAAARHPFDESREGFQMKAGDVIADRYRVVAWLGGGGMGQVYRVEDLKLQQTVALKFLSPRFAADEGWRSRFLHEARTAREITHPNVCRVFDIGEFEEYVFISMEYVDGEDLATLIRRIGGLPRAKVLDMAHQLCGGLAAAHAKGLLHRDLKPANIMLDRRGHIRITDFGLAGAVTEFDQGGPVAGTPAYMAPEQFGGQALSVQTDIYALGLVLYEVLTGRSAFDADDIVGYRRLHQTQAPPPMSARVPGIDPVIERVVHECLEKDPGSRPRSATAVAAALPGGDALAAAMAADRTPSPETVAAVQPRRDALPGTGPLALATAVLLLALVVGRTYVPAPLDLVDSKAPEVLAERSRDIIAAVGYAVRPSQHVAYGFCGSSITPPHGDAFSWADERGAVRVGQGTSVLFWYLQSPRPFTSHDSQLESIRGGRLATGDRTMPGPGGVALALTPAGGLVYFAATPRIDADSPGPDGAVFEDMLDLAELDPESGSSAESTVRTYLPADQRRALLWGGSADAATAVRVDWLAWDDRPILFAVTTGGRATSEASTFADEGRRRALAVTMLQTVLVIIAIMSFPWAWKNHREERADRQAAMRLAAVVFGVELIMWVLQDRHTLDFRFEVAGLCVAGLRALSFGALVWLFYTALEPQVRRHWPHLLVAWRRLLAGHVLDPVVGRHLQIGVCLGVFLAVLAVLDRLVVIWVGWEVRPPLIDEALPDRLLGGRFALAGCLAALLKALFRGLLFLLLLTALRVLLGRPIAAAAVAVLLIAPMYTPQGAHMATSWLTIGVCAVCLVVWAMARFGLLVVVAAILTAELLTTFPMGLHLDLWHADLTILALGMVIVVGLIGVLGARSATSGQGSRTALPA